MLAQGEVLPSPWSPPWGERGLSVSFQGLSTSKRQAQLSTRLALCPLPAGEPWERKCEPLVSRYQSPHASSGDVGTLQMFEVGLPSGSRDFVICYNE